MSRSIVTCPHEWCPNMCHCTATPCEKACLFAFLDFLLSFFFFSLIVLIGDDRQAGRNTCHANEIEKAKHLQMKNRVTISAFCVLLLTVVFHRASTLLCLKWEGGNKKNSKSSRTARETWPDLASLCQGMISQAEKRNFSREASLALLIEHSRSKRHCNHCSRDAKFYF